jgi:pyrroline-5-carboxylate reductase
MMAKKKRLAFVGCGHLGRALVCGFKQSSIFSEFEVLATTKSQSSADKVVRECNIACGTNNCEAVQGADVVILGVKPLQVPGVLAEIKEVLAGKLVISLAAGITLATLEKQSPSGTCIIRTAANLCSQVKAGATAFAANKLCHENDFALCELLLRSVGICAHLDESKLDAITGLSGCGPGFMFALASSMQAAAIECGLKPDIAAKFAAQTLLGAGKMLLESEDASADDLKRQVCTPGGITIQGVTHLEEQNALKAFGDAVKLCTNKSIERSQA